MHHKEESQCDIADLNWARIESWRSLIASTFRKGDMLASLRQVERVSITYNAATNESVHTPPLQSIYLQGWLASRLGWHFERAEGAMTFHYGTEHGGACVELKGEESSSVGPGRLLAIEITSRDGTHHTFRRDLDMPTHVEITHSSPELCSMPVRVIVDKDEVGASLVREICHKGTSRHYLDVLNMLMQLPPEIVCHSS
jgi:hypothetical protein